jgi:hypothetical protein
LKTKVFEFLTSTDGLVVASWGLMSLVFGLSLATGPFSLFDRLAFIAITTGFGAFLLFALSSHRNSSTPKPKPKQKVASKGTV